MTTSKIIIFCTVFITVFFGIYLYAINVSYPVKKTCTDIINYKSKNGSYPDDLSFLVKEQRNVGLLSSLKYKVTSEGFYIYFCPTILGPCEVCDVDGEVYYKG